MILRITTKIMAGNMSIDVYLVKKSMSYFVIRNTLKVSVLRSCDSRIWLLDILKSERY